jgi:hypothetical protein
MSQRLKEWAFDTRKDLFDNPEYESWANQYDHETLRTMEEGLYDGPGTHEESETERESNNRD